MRMIQDSNGVYFNFDLCESIEIIVEESSEKYFDGCIKCTTQSGNVYYIFDDDENDRDILYNRLENELFNLIEPVEL